MKSVYARILAWSLVTLVISMALFFIISSRIEMQMGAGDMYRRVQALALEEARSGYETGGQAGAAAVIARMNRVMGWHYYLLDARGRDLSTGVDRSALIAQVKERWGKPVFSSGTVTLGSRTSDGLYALIVEASLPLEPWTFLPYYGLILLTVALLCWPLALHIGSPLRSLALMVDRFGQGDLSIRARSARRDEIGNLARTFDRMADRIETLLTAERRLLQDVSHELRSPLARLSFATELVNSEPDREKGVARIRKEVSRLSTLVGTLLQMTRAEGDPASGQRTEFMLDELLRELVEDCSVEAEARGCEFAVKCGGEIAMTGNRELVRRAIENVLRNALQYSPEGKVVNVKLESDAGEATIGVRDQGPGVPDEDLTRIFDPFFRVDDSRTGSTGGMGLGLSIAMRAVRLHNGRIEAKNGHPGLLVTIVIPTGESPLAA